MLSPGDPAPVFTAAEMGGNPAFGFDTVAGRPVLMLFAGSAQWAPCAEALALVRRHAHLFDDEHAAFFGVTMDESDAREGRIARRIPGIRWFLDTDRRVSTLYGAVAEMGGNHAYRPYWLLLDRALRVVRVAPLAQGEAVIAALAALVAAGVADAPAPALVVPGVFEPDLCRELVALYDRDGGTESGFMRQQGDRTVGLVDHSFKRRADCVITDGALQARLLDRLRRRLVPEIRRAFQFEATRIERWIVACYDSREGGFFRPHRDNTTTGTAHRRFACTINLNAEAYDGGDLRFPEFGDAGYRAPTGGAVVFSCSLLHEARPVTRGRRYAFLPFFYDEAGAEIRARNQASIQVAAAHHPQPADRP